MKKSKNKECKVDGCNLKHKGHGYCDKHLKKYNLYGDPLGQASKKVKIKCSVQGCNDYAYSRGWCHKHYTRWRIHGDPTHYPYLEENPKVLSADGNYYTLKDCKGEEFLIDVTDYDKIKFRVWNVDPKGYVTGSIDGKTISLHKFLLGNPPKDGLIVDHKNRVTTDNRRNNLHWTTSKNNAINKRFDNAKHIIYCNGNKSPRTKPYQVNYRFDGKRYYLGYF